MQIPHAWDSARPAFGDRTRQMANAPAGGTRASVPESS